MSALGSQPGRRDGGGEERIEARRHFDAVRRSAWLITAIAVVSTGAVLAFSLNLPPTYEATTKIVVEDPTTALGSSDDASVQRRLVTTGELLTTPQVLDAAGKILGVDGRSLRGKVTSSIDAHSRIIHVVGQDRKPAVAAAVADAVSQAFVAQQGDLDRRRIADAAQAVRRQIADLSARARATPQLGALRQRLSELVVQQSGAGTDLQIAERAEVPSAPSSPKPVRNAVLALFAAIFLGILIALARDQLSPRVTSSKEVSRILELPVLGGVPYVGRRLRTRKGRVLSGVENEAYQTLRATVELSTSDVDERVVLVTSAVAGEGKTSVAARLGRALARAGRKTLVVSADLRVPTLHEHFGLPLSVGLADLLAVLDSGSETDMATPPELLERATNVVVAAREGKRSSGCLHVITSGAAVKDPGRLVAGRAMPVLVTELRAKDYDYILLDAPPLLGLADAQVLARWADAILLVSRLDRISLDRAGDCREVLDRFETRALGVVVIGVEIEVSPYYATGRPAEMIPEPEAPA